jgi:cell division protein FtsN
MSTEARDVRGTSEEGFHEIQLSGKQLVFLFMATTVVSIVIFLCGVLVGRGVRGDIAGGERTPQASAAELTPDLGPSATPGKAGGAADEPPTPEDQPVPSTGSLDYPRRLSDAKPVADTLSTPTGKEKATAPPASTPPAEKPAKADTAKADAAAAAKAAPAPPPAVPAPAPANAKAAAPSSAPSTPPPSAVAPAGGKFTVQVAAYAARGDAADLAKKLTGRGYAAYVEPPSAGKGAKMYRVRVGSYADRAEADRMRQKLQSEGKYKPWVTTR